VRQRSHCRSPEVVKIGTTLISKDSKPLIAMRWDGYPFCLGVELMLCDKSLKAVIELAKAHAVDAAHRSVIEDSNARCV
jgi:hypothetical protein